ESNRMLAHPGARHVKPERECIVVGERPAVEDIGCPQHFRVRALVQDKLRSLAGRDVYFVIGTIDLLAVDARQIKIQANEVLTMSEVELELFRKLTAQGIMGRLARIDRAAKAAPVP